MAEKESGRQRERERKWKGRNCKLNWLEKYLYNFSFRLAFSVWMFSLLKWMNESNRVAWLVTEPDPNIQKKNENHILAERWRTVFPLLSLFRPFFSLLSIEINGNCWNCCWWVNHKLECIFGSGPLWLSNASSVYVDANPYFGVPKSTHQTGWQWECDGMNVNTTCAYFVSLTMPLGYFTMCCCACVVCSGSTPRIHSHATCVCTLYAWWLPPRKPDMRDMWKLGFKQ